MRWMIWIFVGCSLSEGKFFDVLYIYETAWEKTYNKTFMTSRDSDQPVHSSNMSRVLVYPYLDSLEVVEGTCDQRRLWSDCADAQADLSLRWSRNSYCRFVVRWLMCETAWEKTLWRVRTECPDQTVNPCNLTTTFFPLTKTQFVDDINGHLMQTIYTCIICGPAKAKLMQLLVFRHC